MMESYRYRKSASKYRVCQKIVHFLFFNVDSTESPDGLQSVLSSAAFPGRLLSLELLSELSSEPPCIHSADWL